MLTLAVDLPSAAAFLAAYRLVEEGKVGTDDAVLLLEAALSRLDAEWIESVGRIAPPAEETVSVSHPVVGAMAVAANHSIARIQTLVGAVAEQVAKLPWDELSGRLEEIRSAFRPLGSDATQKF